MYTEEATFLGAFILFNMEGAVSMRKWIKVFRYSFLLIYVCFIGIRVGATEIDNTDVFQAEFDWTIQWQGLTCTGIYTGEVEYGRPQGEGDFKGNIIIEGKEQDKILYSGEWENGMLNGAGILTNDTKKIVYEGGFSQNKLNGKIKEHTINKSGTQTYVIKNYKDDVPYGVSKEFDENDNIISYDYFFYGISVEEIRNFSEKYAYEELLYCSSDYQNKKIKLQCTVIQNHNELVDGLLYNKLKVVDQDGNYYILNYSLQYKTIATNYVPFFEIGDQIIGYGYGAGLDTFNQDILQIPCINMVYGEYANGDNLDIYNRDYQYLDFLNYPYYYKGTKVKLEGTYKGIWKCTENWMYFLVESDSYGGTDNAMYVCRMKNIAKNLIKLPEVGGEILLEGTLNLVSKYLDENDNYVFCPIVRLTKIHT